MAKSTARLSICSLMLFRLKVVEGIDPDNAPPQLLEDELLEDPPNPPEGNPDDNFFEDDDALSDRDPPNDNVSMHRRIVSPHRLPPLAMMTRARLLSPRVVVHLVTQTRHPTTCLPNASGTPSIKILLAVLTLLQTRSTPLETMIPDMLIFH